MDRTLRVKCLVLDHDDTVVKSTPEINYPAFKESLSVLRPEIELTYEKFTEENFKLGFEPMCRELYKMTDEELEYQNQCWRKASAKTIPEVYEGLPEIINEYVRNGGIVCVSSQSTEKTIRRDYQAAGIVLPHRIYDWDCPRRKPDPFALRDIMHVYGLKPEELLMVDDLKTGYDMASECEVPFACAGWSDNQIPLIREFMKQYGDYYLETTEGLADLLYEDRNSGKTA